MLIVLEALPVSHALNTTQPLQLVPHRSKSVWVRSESSENDADVLLFACPLAQVLVLECMASSNGSHVNIDCKKNRPTQKTLCSFDNQVQQTCMHHYAKWYNVITYMHTLTGSYPLIINRNDSSLGNHSVVIYVEDDEGFQAETTVHYILEEDPTG